MDLRLRKKKNWFIEFGIAVVVVAIALILYERNYIKKQIQPRYEIVCNACEEYLPGIICWGDSLTQGAGGEGITYSSELQRRVKESVLDRFSSKELIQITGKRILCNFDKYKLPEVPVLNMGVGGEDTNTICGRCGAIPFRVAQDFDIPASKDKVQIEIVGGSPLRQGNAGMTWVEINGIRGKIEIEQESYMESEYTYYFSRDKRGTSVKIPAGMEIVTEGSFLGKNYIPVIYIGENGGYSSVEELISQQMAIINHQNMSDCNKGKFIVIGSHTGTREERQEYEKMLQEFYGNQYINLRQYMSIKGIEDANYFFDANINATEEDKARMALGMTPECLESDGLHFNKYGYMLIGKLIYDRMEALGYFDPVIETITTQMTLQ